MSHGGKGSARRPGVLKPGAWEAIFDKPSKCEDERDRLAFEDWAQTCEGNCSPRDLRKWEATAWQFTDEGLIYVNPLVERAWTVWKAARAAPQPPTEDGPGDDGREQR